MPNVRRSGVPRAVFWHLSQRVRERDVSVAQLQAFAAWLDTDPTVPEGKWHKTFEGFHVCGEGELVVTVLRAGQVPEGEELA